jgi:hypothetical protein
MTTQRPTHARTLDVGDIIIQSRNVTPEEVAAVTAVLVTAVGEQAASERLPPAGPDAWAASQRGLRQPIHPGPGRWQRYPL